MFTIYHFIWLFICALVLVASFVFLHRKKPALQKVLSAACVLSVISEVIKTFSVLEMVPSADGSTLYPYLEMQHLPLHLCSIQLIFIFYTRFSSNSKLRETLLAFMYPTCTMGALLAIAMPSIFSNSIDVSQAFTHPLAYQYFLYHVLLIVLGIYIARCGEVDIRPKHFLSSLGILGGLGVLSLYLNSIFAVPTYVNGDLVSVDYSPNLFFTIKTPIGIPLTEKWHWLVYIGIIALLAVVLLALFYLPFFLKNRKKREKP